MCIVFEKKGHIAYLKYDRPEARNSFSPELIVKMAGILDQINADNSVWVVLLGSTTPGMFSAGAYLKLTTPLLTGTKKPVTSYDKLILDDLYLFRKGTFKANDTDRPIIAAIDGFCYAGAFEAVMSTDIRIATQRSVFGLPEVKRGIVAWGGGTSKLAMQIPYAKAMEMNLTGRDFSAEELYDLGFLNAVVEEKDLWDAAEGYAEKIAANAPIAVRTAKQTIKECLGHPLDEVLDIEHEATQDIRYTEDAREGPSAFAEKRKPHWKAM